MVPEKNGLHSGGLNPGPLGHESSALSTRPQLLAYPHLFILKVFILTYFVCQTFVDFNLFYFQLNLSAKCYARSLQIDDSNPGGWQDLAMVYYLLAEAAKTKEGLSFL